MQEAEEADYIRWLKGQGKLQDKTEAQQLVHSPFPPSLPAAFQRAGLQKPLRDFWKSEADEGEQFLKDFILNRRYRAATEDELALIQTDRCISGGLGL